MKDYSFLEEAQELTDEQDVPVEDRMVYHDGQVYSVNTDTGGKEPIKPEGTTHG